MDKKKIEEFATTSRKQLIKNLTYEANRIGITPTGIQKPTTEAEDIQTFTIGGVTNTIYGKQIEQRKQLIEEIETHNFDEVIEKIAYTWFNRIIAIRFMEINNYLPTHTRVLSSMISGKKEPDIITEALDLDLNYTEEEIQQIYKYKTENKTDELFKLLFIKQCNKLNEILPELFETIDDYTEILFNIQLSNENNIINKLVTHIPEDDFNNVEIIGWMYQYYNSELKNEINDVIKPKKIEKHEIPFVTQLFTPEWIVKYMVDNSLGRYWIERNKDSSLSNKLNYYFKEYPQEESVTKISNEIRTNNIKIEDLKFIDPCMGSGHILLYAFDVFYEIYSELGYYSKDIPYLILKNNIYGLEIDDRAYQLSYFALAMKSTQYNNRFLRNDFNMNIYSFQDSNLSEEFLSFIEKEDKKLFEDLNYLNYTFYNAKEFGSLIQVKKLDYIQLSNKFEEIKEKNKHNMLNYVIIKNNEENFYSLIDQAKLLSQKYQIVVTNPPYLNKYDDTLKEFAKENYNEYSKDLFSMFIYRNTLLCKKNGYSAYMTPFVWMFIKNYQKLREYIIDNLNISSLIQLEYSAFKEATVPICTFVLSNNKMNLGIFVRLSDFKGGMKEQEKKYLEAINKKTSYIYSRNLIYLKNIPGSPIAYWVDENLINSFIIGKNLKPEFGDACSGLITSDNNRFLKYWFEVNLNKIGFNCKNVDEAININKKWYPFNKGGEYKKWYGNQYHVINYENDGFEVKEYASKLYKTPSRTIRSMSKYFKPCLSWSKISSSDISVRYYPKGFIFGGASGGIFFEDYNNLEYILGFLNSSISQTILNLISPTLNYESGHISSLPIIYSEKDNILIKQLVKNNIELCKLDWDDYEISWNFKAHPLIFYSNNNKNIKENYNTWENIKKNRFFSLKNNEIEINKIFSEIYSIDFNENIEDKSISITKTNYENDIKSFISYAIGCIFGRYSLDAEKVHFAGGNFNINNYSKIIPDDDNIVPVLDTEYFEDDIVGRFIEFVKVCFGEETLEENFDFITKAINRKGKTNNEIIRNYFLKDFFKDHTKTYKKCPIYWQFDSGKENAFKCLIYMHRYEPDLVSRIRFDYLHKTQRAIEDNIKLQDSIINDSENKSRVNKANKKKTKLIKQLDEIKLYDLALAHVANERIEIDLDDGVKVNYAKFQNIEVVDPNTNKTRKINLLKKI